MPEESNESLVINEENIEFLNNVQPFEFNNTPVDWRYAECNKSVREIYDNVIEKYFSDCIEYSDLIDLNIRFVYYSKRKKRGGKTVFAYIALPSNFELFLEHKPEENATNYFMFIDFYLWNNMNLEYRERIIRHEIRHIDIQYNKKGEKVYSLRDHDYVDFMADMDIEQKPGGNPNWQRALSELADDVYSKVEENRNLYE